MSAAEMLSIAAFLRGKHAQAFPSFGSERMGAPVVSFCRIGDKPIRSREPVTHPNAIVVQDSTLIGDASVFEGLKPQGYLLLNSTHTFGALGLNHAIRDLPTGHCCTVSASEIAMRHVGRAAPNAALLGAFVALSDLLDLESLFQAIRAKFPNEVAEKNIAAARAAYEFVLHQNAECEDVVCSDNSRDLAL